MGTNRLSRHLLNFTLKDTSSMPFPYQCENLRGDRCNDMKLLNLKYPVNKTWTPPNFTLGEGPTLFGTEQPFCVDCSGCGSNFTVCKAVNSQKSFEQQPQTTSAYHGRPIIYGGYINREFARDVELQTAQFPTSQENIAAFVKRAFNKPRMLKDLNGRPVCLISAGQHDAGVPNITTDIYVKNVEWYINIMRPQCEFIIWLGSTLPAGLADYPQTPELIGAWNTAARALIEARPGLNTLFVDVANASKYEGKLIKRDNIHMEDPWYKALAGTFIEALSTSC